MESRQDWVSRVLTCALLIGGAFGTGICVDQISKHTGLSLWFLALAVVVFVAAYLGVRRLATRVTGMGGYALDAAMSVPLGVVFVAKEIAVPGTDSPWSMIFNGVFIGFCVAFVSGYFYRRHPRKDASDERS